MGVCRLFNTSQGCKYGSNCKFSHGIGPRTERPVDQGSNPLHAWRLFIPTRPGIILRPIDFTRFCKLGLELVHGDYAAKQDCILLLASENGLGRVKQMLEQETKRTTGSGARYFEDELLPFFTMLAHPDVATSATLETALVNIYNIIYGPQGARASAIFQFVAQMVIDWSSSQAELQNSFKTILYVFLEVITKNGSAHINPHLVPVAEILFDKAMEMSQDVRNQHASKIRQLAEKLNRQLNMGRSMPVATPHIEKSVQKRARFVQEQLPPGGRHDNDHVDIRDINIMPTYNEVRSHQVEYLPVRGEQGGPEGSQRLLDHHFRLLREDTVGQLRDAVRATLQTATGQGAPAPTGPRTHTYDRFEIVDVFFSRPSGLTFFIRVDQPLGARKLSNKQRMDWWERSNSLRMDALVCIVGLQGSDVYCTVSAHGSVLANRTDRSHRLQDQEQESLSLKYNGYDLHSRPDGAYLTLKPVSHEEKDLLPLLREAFERSGREVCKLVEFPGVLLPAFEPTLLALQNMLTTQDMPFTDILTAGPDDAIEVLPPAYAADPNFFFNLACLTESKENLPYFPRRSFDLNKLLARSTLDEAQGNALIHCLQSSLALIQGPPGTGKSFTGIALIKVLLEAKHKAKLGPIVCVCYINHALDQLLEHLHAAGVEQMIRVGSRSKSEVLEEINLRKVAQEGEQTRAEKHRKWELGKQLDDDLRQANGLLRQIRDVRQPKVLKDYLQLRNGTHYRQLFSADVEDLDDDEEGWQTVERNNSDVIKKWLLEGLSVPQRHPRTVEQLESVHLNLMSAEERYILHEDWLHEIQETTIDNILTVSHSFQQTNERYNNVRKEIDLRCLQDANIIGITTTGLARNLAVLRKLQAKVLVCEEAGEVLEAHILTALLPSLEHVILIGDHQQLRPQVQNYELSRENDRGKKHSLDISLFERLVGDPDGLQPRLPFCTLKVQRRMHPSVSQLIRNTLYPHLQDAHNVAGYPEVVGMKKRLFWLDHAELEDNASTERAGSTSHSNSFEVSMVTSLVDHLVRQGAYQPGEIAVLTPYLAQLFKIRKALSQVMEVTIGERDVADATRQGFELDQNLLDEQNLSGNAATPQIKNPTSKTSLLKAMRVATVDNFQGEEAKVVVISLVRSNPQRKCGFLRTSNRINVLLSRAQHGMYIIGNAATAGENVPMWSQVLNMLQESGNVGTSLQLQCPRHPDTPINASNPEEFVVMSPEGGCGLLCDRRLDCGHPCRQKCHSDVLHAAVVCLEACPRPLKGCDHSCPNPCGNECPWRCNVILDEQTFTLRCGHEITNLACWQSQHTDLVKCNQIVKKQRIISSALLYVANCSHVVMCVRDSATYVVHVQMDHFQLLQIMANVFKSVTVSMMRAATVALNAAMAKSLARPAEHLAQSDVLTRSVPRSAANHVLHAPVLAAHQNALTANALCHVQHHATGYLVANVVSKFSNAAINVLPFVEKFVQMFNIVKCAQRMM
ncbi:hypothetical protein H2198_004039 [Neophaeococcomyces mojaviensis]|uniref:Uncharacterized protein n=1 Tax=Neophaeococcomyces mojaviensis TaxID=3383035 RepID=A0ACC3A9M6_9EURO|nr:hypothetical protein H2198_004039 [Knufia sp. JES_112]